MVASFLDILLVEDNPADVDLLREVAEQATFPVRIKDVSDGVQALAYLRLMPPYEDAARPDLVLLDLNLPKKDGRTVLQEIRSDVFLKELPVVILTTSTDYKDTVNCYEFEISTYLIKPTGFEQYKHVLSVLKQFWMA